MWIQLYQLFSTEPSERCCEQTTRTISGKICQKWNSKSPHEPNKTMLDYLRRHDFIFNRVFIEIVWYFWNLERTTGNINHNQCAFADKNDVKPFCYTTNRGKRWEYCNCKACNSPTQPSPTPTEGSPTPVTVFDNDILILLQKKHLKPKKVCSQTASGRKCQNWNESSPHKPNDQMVNQVIKLTGSSNHNKCAKADVNDSKA